MKTVGQLISLTRKKNDVSIEELEEKTKIKASFLKAMENHEWSKLPEYPVVLGFMKNIARVLEIEEKQAIAFLRRDYPPQKLPINPKPDVEKRFSWTPRLTFILGAGLFFLSLLGYLVYQYTSFTRPPALTLLEPQEGARVSQSVTTVVGKTDADATVIVNNQPALLDDDGNFTAEIEISPDTREIKVVARSRAGKVSEIMRTINPEL